MTKNLVIVESPAKARTIERYLGGGYVVTASKGHVKDLPKNQLGVDVSDGFAPEYVTVHGKGSILKEIRKLSRGADTVYLAPDPDREGEAIAWHIADEIRGNGRRKDAPKAIKRVLINEITRRGIQEAFKHPRDLSTDLFNSQQTRRILDRLVGYQISPLLWDKVRRGLSAGRVQSVAVRLVVDREREIEAFEPVEYWRIEVHLEGSSKPSFWAKLTKLDGKPLDIKNGDDAAIHVAALEAEQYAVARVEKKERRRNPQAPFITSRLQQEASRKLRMGAKKTMMVAQRLYEGVKLGDEGLTGLITYMRTDSTRVADDAITEVRSFIKDSYGPDRLPQKPRQYAKNKKAQDAHEAIRPTSVERTPAAVKSFLNRDQFRLYELIWKRFVASQMASAVFDATTVDISAGDYLLRTTGSVLKFAGFLELYKEGVDDKPEPSPDQAKRLPPLTQGEPLEKLDLTNEQLFTKPPPRFSEATLVRELEERGIGRPSTYAAIISTIQDKGYVDRKASRFHPTELGRVVTDLLVESFPDVLNAEFTAEMEGQLDRIEEGKAGWVDVLNHFYKPFSADLDRAKKEMRDLKRETIPTEIDCDQCGSNMVIRWGRNGSFLACSAYPDCRNTSEFKRVDGVVVPIAPTIETAGTCDKCDSEMVIKTGKYGRFRACSSYPTCKNTAPVTTGVACPTCEQGELVEKRSRRGKTFWGCGRYPDCRYASWDEPINQACAACGNPFIVRKSSRSGEGKVICPKCETTPETVLRAE